MRRPVGRVRHKLAEMLTKELGFFVRAESIWRQSPVHIRFYGCAVWGADGYECVALKDGRVVDAAKSVCSWCTMTECVRYGFVVTKDASGRGYADYEITAKKPGSGLHPDDKKIMEARSD